MMLKPSSGRIVTGAGVAPSGASQPPSDFKWTSLPGTCSPASAVAASASTKLIGAAQSVIIATMLSGVPEGASGVATHPARNAPRKTAA